MMMYVPMHECLIFHCIQFFKDVKKYTDGVNDTMMEYLLTNIIFERTKTNELLHVGEDDLVSSIIQ